VATILIVDDRQTDRKFQAAVMGAGGHRPREAAGGAAALEAARPDLVIADARLPTMNGYECVRLLRATA
jgi:CheY-like chemotaxis protein